MEERRQPWEEFIETLDFGIPDTDSEPISEALGFGKRILEGSEYLTQLDRKWIDNLKYKAVQYLPHSNDIANFYVLANKLAQVELPRVAEILQAMSYGMAYQALLDKHYKTANQEPKE